MSNRPLFVVHHHTTCPGFVGRLANDMHGGYSTLYAPHTDLPDPRNLRAPVVVFGGNMSGNDSNLWLGKELRWLEQLMERDHPIFAICLGAQLVAKVLGERLEACAQGTLECGYTALEDTSDHFPSHVYQWHREGFSGADFDSNVIQHARSSWNNGVCQAFSKGNAVGVQFHPEITEQRIGQLLSQLPHDAKHPSARPAESHLDDHKRYGKTVRQWAQGVLAQQWRVE